MKKYKNSSIASYRITFFDYIKTKYAHIYLFVILFLVLSSCKDLLVENPKSIVEENFYNTEREIETAVNAIYAPLRETPDAGINGINSVLGEFTYGRGSWAHLNNYQGLNDVWITRVSNMWEVLYQGIRNANLVIKNAPQSNSLSQSSIDEFVAEAKFLRGFAYFQLVKNWGGVPIRTAENITKTNVGRSTKAEVYDLIISDLQEAEDNLSDEVDQAGRPSIWAAKTVLSDVYLFLGMYPEARDKADEVISSNNYSLVHVENVADFQKIFGANVDKTMEEIFYFRYSHDSGQGNIWPGLMNHPGTEFYAGNGVYGVYSDTENLAYQEWNDDDLRKGLWYEWDIGVGSGTLLSKKFIDSETIGLASGNPQTWYRYADVLLIYAEAASRVANGPTVRGMEALNQVHRRAYGYDPTSPSPVDFDINNFSSLTFLDLIIKERGYEFQLEGKRWLDLKRTGKAEEIIQDIYGIGNLEESNYLFPIPQNEFNFNNALDPTSDQNPGY